MRLCDSTHTHNMTICWCIVQDEPRLMVIRVRIVDNETYIIAQVKQSLQCDLTMSVRVNLPKQYINCFVTAKYIAFWYKIVQIYINYNTRLQFEGSWRQQSNDIRIRSNNVILITKRLQKNLFTVQIWRYRDVIFYVIFHGKCLNIQRFTHINQLEVVVF